jgi:hypothetical protein
MNTTAMFHMTKHESLFNFQGFLKRGAKVISCKFHGGKKSEENDIILMAVICIKQVVYPEYYIVCPIVCMKNLQVYI